MKTIHVITDKLIKYIPSEPDGETIPGAVVSVDTPRIFRENNFVFRLQYMAKSKVSQAMCTCRLDEELDVVTNSNLLCSGWQNRTVDAVQPVLIEDGVTYRFESGRKAAQWIRLELVLPDPFDSLGIPHVISCFESYRAFQVATLTFGNRIMLAIISQKKPNSVSSFFFTSDSGPVAAGEPCRHNDGLMIPYSTPGEEGLRILWISNDELDKLIDESSNVPCEAVS